MNLFEQINTDIKQAIKSREKEKLNALRAIKAQLLLAKTENGAKDTISDEKSVKILQKMVKQRKDSAEIYKQQNRNDLYEKEINEVKYIIPYLPQQLSDAELDKIIAEIIQKTGATSIKDMGKVMGMASKQLQGKAENKIIAGKIKKILG